MPIMNRMAINAFRSIIAALALIVMIAALTIIGVLATIDQLKK